jgi:hypothetical protein
MGQVKSPEGATEDINIKGPSPLAVVYLSNSLFNGFASLTPGYVLTAPVGMRVKLRNFRAA